MLPYKGLSWGRETGRQEYRVKHCLCALSFGGEEAGEQQLLERFGWVPTENICPCFFRHGLERLCISQNKTEGLLLHTWHQKRMKKCLDVCVRCDCEVPRLLDRQSLESGDPMRISRLWVLGEMATPARGQSREELQLQTPTLTVSQSTGTVVFPTHTI